MSIARASAHASAGRRVARLGSFCDQSRRSLDALDRRRLAPMALKLRAVCEYFGERTTYATAAARCDAFGEDTCPYTQVSNWDGCMNGAAEVRAAAARGRASARAACRGGSERAAAASARDGRRTTNDERR